MPPFTTTKQEAARLGAPATGQGRTGAARDRNPPKPTTCPKSKAQTPPKPPKTARPRCHHASERGRTGGHPPSAAQHTRGTATPPGHPEAERGAVPPGFPQLIPAASSSLLPSSRGCYSQEPGATSSSSTQAAQPQSHMAAERAGGRQRAQHARRCRGRAGAGRGEGRRPLQGAPPSPASALGMGAGWGLWWFGVGVGGAERGAERGEERGEWPFTVLE